MKRHPADLLFDVIVVVNPPAVAYGFASRGHWPAVIVTCMVYVAMIGLMCANRIATAMGSRVEL